MAHALTSSPFQQADVLVVDSAGEWSTVSGAHVKRGQEWQVEPLLEVPFPHSIGLVGSALTTWAGFRASEGEDELLKLAVHGEPIHRALFEEILPALTDGTFRLEKGWVHVEELETAPYGCPLSSRWIEKLGPPRDSRLGWTLGSVDGSSPTAVDQNVANVVASFEAIKFDRVLALCHRLQQQTNARRLCLTGPLAANPQLIRRLAESGPYEHIHVPWETGTLGAAAGAASLVGKEEHKVSTKRTQISPYMGMSLEYADDLAMIPLLKPNKWARFRKRGTQDPTGATVEVTHFKEDLEGLATAVAEALAQGTPVGWLQDRFGDGQGARGRRVLLASAGSRQAWEDIRTGITGQPPYHRPSLVISQEEARVVLPRADLSSRAVCWGQQEVWVAPASRERVQGCLLDDAHLTALVCTSDDHPKLSILLRRWREISGVGALAATPLKEHGTPIATDLAEASIILARTNLTLLVVGDALITKRWS